jgi:hypothetical protein
VPNRLFSALVWSPRSKDRGLVRALLVWNPIVALGFDVTFGGVHDLLRRWAISLVIADTVTVICFGAVVAGTHLETAVRARRGKGPKARPMAWYFGLSALLLPLALPAGLWAGARFGVLLGEPFRAPDLHNYRLGLAFGAIATMLFFLHHARREAREAALAAEARIRAQAARCRTATTGCASPTASAPPSTSPRAKAAARARGSRSLRRRSRSRPRREAPRPRRRRRAPCARASAPHASRTRRTSSASARRATA